MYDEIKGEVASALLALIAREREGEAIDQSLIAAVVGVFDHSACHAVLLLFGLVAASISFHALD